MMAPPRVPVLRAGIPNKGLGFPADSVASFDDGDPYARQRDIRSHPVSLLFVPLTPVHVTAHAHMLLERCQHEREMPTRVLFARDDKTRALSPLGRCLVSFSHVPPQPASHARTARRQVPIYRRALCRAVRLAIRCAAAGRAILEHGEPGARQACGGEARVADSDISEASSWGSRGGGEFRELWRGHVLAFAKTHVPCSCIANI